MAYFECPEVVESELWALVFAGIAAKQVMTFVYVIVDQLMRESRTRFATFRLATGLNAGLTVGLATARTRLGVGHRSALYLSVDVLVSVNTRPTVVEYVVDPERVLHRLLPLVVLFVSVLILISIPVFVAI